MNKKILFALPMSILAIACAPLGKIQIGNCLSQVYVGPCTGNRNVPKVTINVNAPLTASPPHVCAAPGKDIEFKIVPPPSETGTVAIVPKDAADTWLVSTNFPDAGIINIKSPGTLVDSFHDYWILTNGGACLDPRIHVN